MSNHETFEPMGLVDLTLASAQAKLKKNRERLDDMTERLQSALDAKRDVASDYANQLDTAMKRNESLWKDGYRVGHDEGHNAGYDEGHSVGYDQGYKAGRDAEMKQSSEQRDRDLLESHGIDIEPLFENVQKIIADHERDIDEDEPDQYPPEAEKWGGTK